MCDESYKNMKGDTGNMEGNLWHASITPYGTEIETAEQ